MFDEIEVDENVLQLVMFSDEVTFHISGQAHHRNVRIWTKEFPYA